MESALELHRTSQANKVPLEIRQKLKLVITEEKTEYLDPRLNVKIAHSMFKAKYPDFDKEYKFYLKYSIERVSLRTNHKTIVIKFI